MIYHCLGPELFFIFNEVEVFVIVIFQMIREACDGPPLFGEKKEEENRCRF